MTRLTEEMVIARAKLSDLASIKKLNCWGSDLSDVSIIRRMRGVEVLALSVNKISTLQHFEDCTKLQELYLRKNNITDINEIGYLQNLPFLKYLWLEENPCCEKAGPNYRKIILRALPNLKKLDNVEVTPEELEEALNSVESPAPQDDTYGYEQQRQNSQQGHYQQIRRSSTPTKEEYYTERSPYPAQYRHSQTDLTEWEEHQQHHHHHPQQHYGSTVTLNHAPRRSSGATDMHERHTAYRNGSARENGDWDDAERHKMRRPDSANMVSPAVFNHYAGYHRRPVNRSSNLLSATLCLVKELDYSSLEVVEHAIRCRIDELATD